MLKTTITLGLASFLVMAFHPSAWADETENPTDNPAPVEETDTEEPAPTDESEPSDTDTETDTDTDTETDTDTDTDTETETDTETDTETTPDTETDTESEPVTDPETDTETTPDTESEPVTVPDTESPDTETQPEPVEISPDAEPVTPDVETQPETQPTTPDAPTTAPPTLQENTTDPNGIAVSGTQAVACKVIVVDRAAKTVTVEANGQLHLLQMTDDAKIMNNGELVSLDDVTSGQEIVVLARTQSDGSIQVVSLAIGSSPEGVEEAGSRKARARRFAKRRASSPGFSRASLRALFRFLKNPANNVGDRDDDDDDVSDND